jgi:hypothetical protein
MQPRARCATTSIMEHGSRALALAAGLAGCVLPACADATDAVRPPAQPPTNTQNNAWTTNIDGAPAASRPADPRVVVVDTGPDPSHVLVLETTHLDHPAEVVGVVDVHEPVANVEQALEVLRRKAARLGADAVVGVEFHHGEGEDEPTHLSGLAVRYRVSE